MDEKLRFIFEYERDEQTMTEWCGRLGICRDTGYVWLRRYQQYGLKGLAELDRAARQYPNRRQPRWSRQCWICARRTCAGAGAS